MVKKMHHQILQQKDALIEEIKFKSAVKNRKIYFNTEVNDEEVFKCAYLIEKILKLDIQEGTKEPITFAISSPGGSIYDGLFIVSLMESLKSKGYIVKTETNTMSASMAFIFAIVGSKGHRGAHKYSSLMFHQVSSGTWGTLQEMQEDNEETKRLWEILKKITIENTKMTDEQLEKIKREKFNYWMSPQEAIELGVIDYIIE